MQFPAICFLNKYLIGDTVLIEPIARYFSEFCEKVYIKTPYPELLENHPSVTGIHYNDNLPPEVRLIDLNDAIKPYDFKELKKDKFNQICKLAGVSIELIDQPRLFLSQQEKDTAEELRKKFCGTLLGIAIESSSDVKGWPHLEKFIARKCRDYQVFVFAEDNEDGRLDWLKKYPIIPFFGEPLRLVMSHISGMDIMFGPDTGLLHISAALGVPSVIVGFDWFSELYQKYASHIYIKAPMYMGGMNKCSARLISKKVKKLLSETKKETVATIATKGTQIYHKEIGLFRLDGLGGTITITDQAKKIYEKTGRKSVAIVRNYGDVFKNNPYFEDVIEVGHVVWGESLNEMLGRFDTIAEIRFAPAKWHQQKEQIFEQDFNEVQGLFDDFPHNYNKLEIHELHHVQLTDKYLGLPYDTIDMEIYHTEPYPESLPDKYVVVANGVDAQYKGMWMTKTWEGWDALVKLVDIPFVQVGTKHDPLIRGVIDLRGKTNIPQLFDVMKRSTATVCTEGGLMHVAYAVRAENVFIIRGPTRGKLFEYPGQKFIDSYICHNCWSEIGDWYARCAKDLDAVCMKTITPGRVAYNLQEVLNEDMV